MKAKPKHIRLGLLLGTHLDALPAVPPASEKILGSLVDGRAEPDTGRPRDVNHPGLLTSV